MTYPVESVIPGIAASLSANRDVVLRAPPGSGKTTCVPPALMDAEWLKGKKILMLEPRRLAARSSAAWIARKIGVRLGDEVGYSVRLERKVSAKTRLEILTEGLLANRFIDDPELGDVGLIIFDEFHERSLQCDLGFAMALEVRRALRPDLRILVMSATLDTGPIAAHLGDADIHTAEARMYPVEVEWLRTESTAPMPLQMAGAVRRMISETQGTVLCFLPGEGEIRRAAEALRDVPNVYPLYGAMDRNEQDGVIAEDGIRKVILATSIAETSLTIPGVTAVIDSGLMRVSRFSPSSGMSRLETLPITRDRAEQRKGRAGRLGPGKCLRLWTEAKDRMLLDAMKPEILDADLASTVLASAMWGTVRADGLPWLTLPPDGNWGNAVELLKELGALDRNGLITQYGKRMAAFGAHPRLANMMMRSGRADLAAIVEEGAPHGITDIREVRLTPRMRQLAARWERAAKQNAGSEGEALAYAYPDRIGKNRGNGTFRLSGGRGACLERTDPLSNEEYLVCCELDDAGGDAKIRLAAPISEAAIMEMFADSIREVKVCEWDRRAECVHSVIRRQLGEMVLSERDNRDSTGGECARAMAEGIRIRGAENLPCWTRGARQFQTRICFMHRQDETWPDVGDAALSENAFRFFGDFLDGFTRWSHLEKLDMMNVLSAAISAAGHDRRELDRLMPVTMKVPSGSEITIHYDEAEPYCEVRLQECFGLLMTPKTAGGKVPIVMRLLSPAHRPIQITKDLAGFWKDGYPLVRKDMRGRYPKHYWPEDPFTAVATRSVRPR